MTTTETAYDKAKKVRDQISNEVEAEKVEETMPVRVEGSREVAVSTTRSVSGFSDLPGSIIRVPYYRLVHPNSRGTELEDGQRAAPGSYLTDMNEEVKEVRMAIIRTKHDVIDMETKENGRTVIKKKPIIRILAVDTKTLSPFQINITKGSFYNLGDIVLAFTKKQAKHSYDYPVVMSSEYVETADNPYWSYFFRMEDKPFNQEEIEIMQDVAIRYASALDHANESEDANAPRDSQGRVIDDIPFDEETEGRPF